MAPWLVELETRSIHLGGRWIRTYSSQSLARDSHAAIYELAAGALDTYRGLVRRGTRKVGLMGHVGRYVSKHSSTAEALQTWQIKRADHVFAYTEAGKQLAIRTGKHPDDVTAFLNTVSTADIIAAQESLSERDVQHFRREAGLRSGPVTAYVGALDGPKRIEFLANALDILWSTDRELQLLVGGAGPDESYLRPAVDRGQVVMLGRVGPVQKALLSRVACMLLNPGRVGLIAVDGFAMGLPLITVDWSFHAPEVEYLSPSIDSIFTADNPQAYAEAISQLIAKASVLDELRANARSRAGSPDIAASARRFANGVRTMLRVRPRDE